MDCACTLLAQKRSALVASVAVLVTVSACGAPGTSPEVRECRGEVKFIPTEEPKMVLVSTGAQLLLPESLVGVLGYEESNGASLADVVIRDGEKETRCLLPQGKPLKVGGSIIRVNGIEGEKVSFLVWN